MIVRDTVMYRSLFKFAALSITILTAELVANIITEHLVSYKWQYKPLAFTALSMAIIVLVFYPLLTQFEKWFNKFSKRFVKAGHVYFGKYLGLLFMYVIALMILTCIYAKRWYGISLVSHIVDGKVHILF